jgi:hypothetical protein
MVMATGIVSVTAYYHQYWRLGIALSILAVVAFAVLGLRFLIWIATRPARVAMLARDPDFTLQMFTFVACGDRIWNFGLDLEVCGARFDHAAI